MKNRQKNQEMFGYIDKNYDLCSGLVIQCEEIIKEKVS